jgi:type VI secretion system protein ImpA
MPVIDPAKFTGALAPDNPSGPNLEYDPDFLALERAQQGKPEQVMGETVKPAEDPDWRDVRERAQALLGRSRDLRVAYALTAALLKIDGLPGLAAGLTVICQLLEGQWDTVHPQLDADDDNDPTLRLNSLAGLTAADGLLRGLRDSPVVQSKTLGRFGLRDMRIASGKVPAPAGMSNPPQQVQIDAAFRDADLESLQASAEAVAVALDQVAAVDRLLMDKVGSRAPDLKPLGVDLTDLKRVLSERLAGRGAAGAEETGAAEEPAGGAPAASAEVGSRDDVIRTLDRLCEYYRRFEPSSPIPLLLQRAKRLVAKSFMEIIRDMTPSGVAEAELLGGVEKKSE